MSWIDIAAIVFAATTVNHLGLIRAVERVVRHRLWVIDCPKCLTFWCVLALGMSGDGAIATHPSALTRLLAVSLFCSYLAIWLELIEGLIDKLYDYVYHKIYPAAGASDDHAQRA